MMPDSDDPVILGQNDADRLNRFLMQRAESSLMLLSNVRSAGIAGRGGAFTGTYAACGHGETITGVAAHYWNGMVVLQAPGNAARLLIAALAASGRECTGIAGPYEQVQEALAALPGKTIQPPVMNGRDTLFSIRPGSLIVPKILQQGEVSCRHPADSEIATLIRWRIAFMQEHMGPDLSQSREDEARELVASQHETGSLWVLEKDGTLVATTAFSACIPEMVQVGGVYTLPEYRNRGYGRAVVAGALLEAGARGVAKAILFTGADMPAAQRMYRSLGFRPIGEYGLVIFHKNRQTTVTGKLRE